MKRQIKVSGSCGEATVSLALSSSMRVLLSRISKSPDGGVKRTHPLNSEIEAMWRQLEIRVGLFLVELSEACHVAYDKWAMGLPPNDPSSATGGPTTPQNDERAEPPVRWSALLGGK